LPCVGEESERARERKKERAKERESEREREKRGGEREKKKRERIERARKRWEVEKPAMFLVVKWGSPRIISITVWYFVVCTPPYKWQSQG
jgi:hypothetical protein